MSHSTTPFADFQEWARARAAAIAEQRGGAAYAELIATQRLLQDRVAGAVLPPDVLATVTDQLTALSKLLADHQAPEPERWDGWRPDLPGRAMPLLPPYEIDSRSASRVTGRVRFTRFYLGGNGAAHGGSHALLFDDVMGGLASSDGVARTAYLTTNYRRITPLDVELGFEASVDEASGRKRFCSARLYDPAGQVVADSSALFVCLLPGQQ